MRLINETHHLPINLTLISLTGLFNWRASLDVLSLSNLCRSKHPNQLLDSEVKNIKEYLLNDRFENWSSLSIYYQALRDNALFITMHTWYKYARKLGIKRKFFRINVNHKKDL